jgi:hypothetical protein
MRTRDDKLKADTFEAVLGAVHLDCRAATAGATAVPCPVSRILAKVLPGFSTTAGARPAEVAIAAVAMANADAEQCRSTEWQNPNCHEGCDWCGGCSFVDSD